MPRRSPDGAVPKRATLYEIAAAQAGYFSIEQAAEAGHSRQLLQYRLRSGEIERSLRGVYRLVQFPSSDREDLVPVWLWTNRQGVFGLETALAIHGLSDVLPAHHDVLVPSSWAKRRVKAPHQPAPHRRRARCGMAMDRAGARYQACANTPRLREASRAA
jgi:predicted transcriptional regulator of viral defense system